MSEGKIRTEVSAHCGRIIIDNPERHNAMSQSMWIALGDAMETFDADGEVRVIVLEGAGDKAFISGADISKFEQERADPARVHAYEACVNRGYESLQHAGTPTIAKIGGYCFGGGMGIAVCCDMRICSDHSSFCIPAARLGVGYGHKNTKVLVDLVGPAFAKEIFFTARRFSAAEARTMGLVNRVVTREALDETVNTYVQQIGGNAPLSVRASNLIINELLKAPADQDLEQCVRWANDCTNSEDINEGRRAFMEKRPPQFQGR